jgi:hypothetical protein
MGKAGLGAKRDQRGESSFAIVIARHVVQRAR